MNELVQQNRYFETNTKNDRNLKMLFDGLDVYL